MNNVLARASSKQTTRGLEADWRELDFRESCFSVSSLSAHYGQGLPIIKDLTFEFSSPATYSIFGSNGVGKTTLFNVITGSYTNWPQEVERLPCAYMIQHYASSLLPWRSVEDNLHFPFVHLLSRESYWHVAASIIESCDAFAPIQSWRKRKAAELSGGQQQLVALLRACTSPDPIIVLDEPFASIDFSVRKRLGGQLRAWSKLSGKLLIASIHSLPDAFFFANTILLAVQAPLCKFEPFDLPSDRDTTGWLDTDDARALQADITNKVYSA